MAEEEVVTIEEFIQSEMKKDEKLLTQLNTERCKICTFGKGKIRQELYGCRTCYGSESEIAVCMACFLECHMDHDTYEIGHKRESQCECGKNEKTCTLEKLKNFSDENSIKDHNFKGKFCICDQEYDPNSFMVRCISCEDYFHPNHIGLGLEEVEIVTNNDDYGIMVCPGCLKDEFAFIRAYEEVREVVLPITKIDQDEKEGEQENTEITNLPSKEEDEICRFSKFSSEKLPNKPFYLTEYWHLNICQCSSCQLSQKVQTIMKEYIEMAAEMNEEEEVKIDESLPQLNSLYKKAESEFQSLATMSLVDNNPGMSMTGLQGPLENSFKYC